MVIVVPVGKYYIDGFKDLEQYHQQLIDKNYKYNRPGLGGCVLEG